MIYQAPYRRCLLFAAAALASEKRQRYWRREKEPGTGVYICLFGVGTERSLLDSLFVLVGGRPGGDDCFDDNG